MANNVSMWLLNTNSGPMRAATFPLAFESRRSLDPKCPACGGSAVVRMGSFTPHGAHKPEYDSEGCSGGSESSAHLLGKLLLRDAIRAGANLFANSYCPCGCPKITHDLLKGADYAKEEVSVAGRRLDVGVFREGRLFGGFEVLKAHAVEPNKWEELRLLGLEVHEVPVDCLLNEDGSEKWTALDALHITASTTFNRSFSCPARIKTVEKEAIKRVALEALETLTLTAALAKKERQRQEDIIEAKAFEARVAASEERIARGKVLEAEYEAFRLEGVKKDAAERRVIQEKQRAALFVEEERRQAEAAEKTAVLLAEAFRNKEEKDRQEVEERLRKIQAFDAAASLSLPNINAASMSDRKLLLTHWLYQYPDKIELLNAWPKLKNLSSKLEARNVLRSSR